MKKKYIISSVIAIVLLATAFFVVNKIFATTIYRSGVVIITNSNTGAESSNEYLSIANKIIENESTDKEIVLETTVTNIRKNAIDYPTENENEIIQIALVADTVIDSGDVLYSDDIINFIDLIKSNNINSKMSFSTTDDEVATMGTDIEQIKSDITTKLDNYSPFGSLTDGLESGINSFLPNAENKVMVIFSYGFLDSIEDVKSFANENKDVNIIVVLIDNADVNKYSSLNKLENVSIYSGQAQKVDFATSIEEIKEIFKNEIKNIVIQNIFPSNITDNFIIQNYNTGASLNTNFKYTIPTLAGKETETFKYKLILKDSIDRDTMFKEIPTNDTMSVTYDGQTTTLQLSEVPKVKIAERFKINIKAIDEENTVISKDIKFNVEVIDTDGQVIYKKNNLEVNQNGLLAIDELAFSNSTGEITIKISEAIVPEDYKATLKQEIKLNVGDFLVTSRTDKLDTTVLPGALMNELDVEVITEKLDKNVAATITMHFYKHDKAGNKLGNVVFSVQEVTDELGTDIMEDGISFEAVTDEEGEAQYTYTITEMKEHYFKVKETQTVTGYKLPDWDITYLLSIDEVENEIYNSGSGTVVNGDYVYDWAKVDNGKKKVDVYFDFSNEEDASNSKWIQVIKENQDGESLDGASFSMIVRYEDGGSKKIYEDIYTVAGQGYIISRPIQITGKTTLELEETKAPEGYKSIKDKIRVVLIENENGIEVQQSTLSEVVKKPVLIDNERIAITILNDEGQEEEKTEKTSVSFEFNKEDEYGNKLGGVLLKAVETDAGGNELEDGATFFATTNKYGQATVTSSDIRIGESYFSIYETKTVPGHELITKENPIRIKITIDKKDESIMARGKLVDGANGAVLKSGFLLRSNKNQINVTMHIVNKESHSKSTNLQILKIDADTNKVLPKVNFEMLIKYKDNNGDTFTEQIVQKIKTDDLGLVYIKNPIEISEETSIELREVDGIVGYESIIGKVEIMLEEINGQIVGFSDHENVGDITTTNGVTTATIKNKKIIGNYPLEIEINKSDKYGNLLGNVQFDIIQVTDATGETVTDNAEPKTIITNEDGYGRTTVRIDQTGETYLKIMERNTVPGFEQISSNIIYKLNIEEISGNYRNVGSTLISKSDNINTIIKVNNRDKIVNLTMNIKNEENLTEYKNVKIIKQNQNGDRLSNAQYSMIVRYVDGTSKKLYDNIVTNENGECTILRNVELQENTVLELSELTPPEGYKKVNNSETITLLKENGSYTADYSGCESVKSVDITSEDIIITLEDELDDGQQAEEKDTRLEINITKLDEYENLLNGVDFTIIETDKDGNEIENGKRVESIKTDKDGLLTANLSLRTGKDYYFLLYETKTVPGHEAITKDKAVFIKMKLRSNSGRIYSGGSKVESENGCIQNVLIRDNSKENKVQVDLTLKNNESHKNYKNVQIVKKDKETGEYLSDTYFAVEVYYVDNTSNEYTEVVTKELVTDSTGTINIESPIEVEGYTSIKIKEIKAKKGYKKIEGIQEVALYTEGDNIVVTPVDSGNIKEIIQVGDTIKIVIENSKEQVIPEGTVAVDFNFSKQDIYKNKLGGVEFTIAQTDSAGNLIANGKSIRGITTDENGIAEAKIELDTIDNYYFMIYETKTVPGHKPITESDPIKIKISLTNKDGKIVVGDKSVMNYGGDSNNISISASDNSCHVKLNLKNEENHTQGRIIEIAKFNEGKTQMLEGAIFTAKIEYQDELGNIYTEKIENKLKTDGTGKVALKPEIEIAKLTTVKIKEIMAPDGYERIYSENEIKISMNEDGTIDISSDTGDITFAIYEDENCIQIQMENKKKQDVPTPTPTASTTPTTTPTATASPATPDKEELKKNEYAIEIRKENSENSSLKVKGAQFNLEVESQEANYYEQFEQLETDNGGRIYKKFSDGTGNVTITVKETKAPKEYKINEETYVIKVNIQRDENNNILSITPNGTNENVEIANKNKIILTIKDEPNPQIVIAKEDKDDNKVKIGGVYFKVQELDQNDTLQGNEEIVTDQEGLALKYVGDKTNGTYYYVIEELYKVEGYLQNNQQVKLKVTYVDGKINEPSVEILEGQDIATINKILPSYIEISIKNKKEVLEEKAFTLDVIKTDSNNINIRIPGAMLNVKITQDDKRTLVKEDYVDEEAKLRIEDISGSGDFKISIGEVIAPGGRELDGTIREINLSVDPKTKAITYNYQEDVTIKIHQEERLVEIFLPNRQEKQYYTMVVKTINETTGNMITGIPLEISLDGTNEKYMKSTDEYGQIAITKIDMPVAPTTRTYTIKECNSGKEFKLYMVFNYDTDGKSIIVDTEQTKLLNNTTERIENIDKQYVEVVIPTRQDYYEIEILKKDENGNPLPGVKYSVKVNDEKNDYITDTDGKVLLSNRKEDGKIDLEIKEIETVSGYELNGLTHYATIIRNSEYESIQIVDYTNIEKIEVKENKIYIELRNELIDENSIYWTLELNKYGTTEEEKLKNIKFFIQGENLEEEGTIITDEFGKYIWKGIKVPKRQGEYKYIIKEKQSPDGYTKKENIELIVKVEQNESGELEIKQVTTENQGVQANISSENYVVVEILDDKVNEDEAYTIKILKKDENGNSLAGAIFSTTIKELQTSDEEKSIESTNDLGEITIGPREGQDILLEILELYAPEGYKPNGITKYIRFSINNETKEIEKGELLNIADEKVIIDNEKRIVKIIIDNEVKPENYTPFTLELTKTNTLGNLIDGARFKISGPNIDEAIVVLNKGIYEWNWLEMPTTPGVYQYKIKEIITPSGYQSIPEELILNLEFAYNGNGKMVIVGGNINSVYADLNNTYIKEGNKVGLRLVNYKIGEQIPIPTPSATPTILPTSTPTVIPTETPDVKPTTVPTVQPTGTPDVTPTSTPTVLPTKTPDVKPTTIPTVQPTETPNVKPTSSTSTPTIKTTPTSGNISTGNNNNNNNNGKLPQTGKTTYIVISSISVAIITGGIYLIRKYVLR